MSTERFLQTGRLGDDTVLTKKVKDGKLFKRRTRGFEHVEKEFLKHNGADGFLPKRGTSGSAGYDFRSPVDVTILPGEQFMIWTNVKAYLQPNEVLLIDVRSSIGTKYGIVLGNTLGVVDSDYYSNPQNDGNIGLCLKNTGKSPFEIKRGDKVCQGIFVNYLIADNDNPVDKNRVGGFGSTDKKGR